MSLLSCNFQKEDPKVAKPTKKIGNIKELGVDPAYLGISCHCYHVTFRRKILKLPNPLKFGNTKKFGVNPVYTGILVVAITYPS